MATAEPTPDDGLVTELRHTLAQLEAALSSIQDALAITDGRGQVIWCNAPFHGLSGCTRLGLLGQWIGHLLPLDCSGGPLLPQLAPHTAPRQSGSCIRVIASQPLQVMELQWTPVAGQNPGAVIFCLRDVSALIALREVEGLNARLQASQQELARQLLECPVTGLPNRRGLLEALHRAIAALEPGGAPLAVIFCDLDRFKEVNDGHGHQAGDELLQAIGRRMAEVLRPQDVIGRLGGDEFVVVCRQLGRADEALEIAARLQHSVGRPWRLGRELLQPRLSMGIAVSNDPAVAAGELLRRADLAMYEAKAQPGQVAHLYEGGIDTRQQQARNLLRQLRRALAGDGLVVVFQPIVHLPSGRRVGHEALVRLPAADGGLIAPDRFIPLAERSGLIQVLGSHVLRLALQHLAQCDARGATSATLAVNTSPQQLAVPEFGLEVLRQCAASGIAPSRLRLEITETSLLSPSEHTLANMEQLRGEGVELHLDDFGTGLSSLSLLSDLPIDAVKIDRSFTAELGRSRPRTAVIEAVIGLCGELGLQVIAEGIETEHQHTWLRQQGCGYGQGFLLGRPGPLDAGASDPR
ncbi:MAG: EAL domain-containing protein [Cyanobacteriota bacterium]|nr:EAL domain-containing protein [Cyanobacteriota bacterium]